MDDFHPPPVVVHSSTHHVDDFHPPPGVVHSATHHVGDCHPPPVVVHSSTHHVDDFHPPPVVVHSSTHHVDDFHPPPGVVHSATHHVDGYHPPPVVVHSHPHPHDALPLQLPDVVQQVMVPPVSSPQPVVQQIIHHRAPVPQKTVVVSDVLPGLLAEGLREVEVRGDGNCQFRALAWQGVKSSKHLEQIPCCTPFCMFCHTFCHVKVQHTLFDINSITMIAATSPVHRISRMWPSFTDGMWL